MTARLALVRGPEANEAALVDRWLAGAGGTLRLEDGRSLRVIYPGGPGAGSGPDCPGAVLDIDGDLVRGDVEVHLLASGWQAHGHDRDPAYAGVALHVVGRNDTGRATTANGPRQVPLLVLRALPGSEQLAHPAFVPPCALLAGRTPAGERLERLGMRRLQAKAVAAGHLSRAIGPAGTLWALLLETCGGGVNRAAFAALARQLPLAVLLERVADIHGTAERCLALTAELRHAGRSLVLQRAGLRPMAAPGVRITVAARLAARLWSQASDRGWPAALDPGANLIRTLRVEGCGRATAIEVATNAVLPVALASGAWSASEVERAWLSLPSPGTYGRLRRLEGWLSGAEAKPLASTARQQGALLLQRDYCTQGRCGRCPLS